MLKRIALACALVAGTSAAAHAAAGFIRVGPMAFERFSAAAVALPDGSVLVASGTTVERFDPASRTFSKAGDLAVNRGTGLSMTLLGTGKVLIAGGQPSDASLESAELFDPLAGTSSLTGDMSEQRSFHTATLLDDGRVLITGGHRFNFVNSALDTAETYDPGTGLFTPLADRMQTVRQDHTATRLADGKVLLVGGFADLQPALASAELFDPDDDSLTPVGGLVEGRGSHTATLLPTGHVVVLGGSSGDPLASVEIYDPGAAAFAPLGTLMTGRVGHTATPLPDGTLLIAGGNGNVPYYGAPLASAEIFDPVSGDAAPTASLHEARGRHVAAPLPGGEVLVAGGLGPCCGGGLTSAEVFSLSVDDTTPPVVTVPQDITVVQEGPLGAVVNYLYYYPPISAADDVDPAPSLSCEPASGSTFPVGTTTVVCTATDFSGNPGTGQFHVTVLEALAVSMTIDANAKIDPRTRLATLSGRVSCNRTTQGYIALELSQDGSPAAQGSASRSFRCVPPSFRWTLSASAQSGRFQPGTALARVSGSFYELGFANPTAERSVRLVSGIADGGEFPLARIADRSTRMPGSRSTFGSFGLPFVRDGVVVFQGYGPTLSEAGLYSSNGGRLAVIADTRTPIPGGTGTFTALDSPAFDGVSVVFQGQDAASGFGLYRSAGGSLAKVANSATPVPGGGGAFSFRGFIGPVVAGSRIAFRGSSEQSAWGAFGVYTAVGQTLRRVADVGTPVPGTSLTFGSFGHRPVVDGDSVVFPAYAEGYGHSGIYSSRNGSLAVVADSNTPIPGGSGGFFAFGAPASSGGVVAFTGADASYNLGVYRKDAGVLRRIVDRQTVVPGSSATFGFIDNPVVENGVVVFGAVTNSYQPAGLYASTLHALSVVADLRTPVPGGQGVFSSFDTRPILANSSVAFIGADSTGSSGIYVRRSGVIHKVISDTDTLDGKVIGWLRLAAGESCDYYFCNAGYGMGFDGQHVTFHVQFGDGSQAIYLASLDRDCRH